MKLNRLLHITFLTVLLLNTACSNKANNTSSSINECITTELNSFCKLVIVASDCSIIDSFCNNQGYIEILLHNSIGYTFSAYSLKSSSFKADLSLGLYMLYNEEDKVDFYEFFRKSGYIKSPFILIEDKKHIYSISTHAQMNKDRLVQFYRQIEKQILEKYANARISYVNI